MHATATERPSQFMRLYLDDDICGHLLSALQRKAGHDVLLARRCRVIAYTSSGDIPSATMLQPTTTGNPSARAFANTSG
jgi:hypothetical protein